MPGRDFFFLSTVLFSPCVLYRANNIHELLETLPLTKLEFPLHIHIWNAFSLSFKYPHFGGVGGEIAHK